MDPDRVARLVSQQANTRQRLEERAMASVLRLVAGFDGWYDHPAITLLIQQVVARVEAAQRQTARLTDTYLTRVASEMVSEYLETVGIIDPGTLRAGITHEGVYGRLADQYRFQVSTGVSPADALAAVLTRAQVMVSTDIQLAFTHQSSRWMTEQGWEEWRRVLRPELSKTGTCGLCIAASDRIYFRGNLLPVHGNCHCTVLPIKGGVDPGRSLNVEDLDRLYADAGSTRADALISTKYRVEENGEIGPVLVHEDHSFRGPGDIP